MAYITTAALFQFLGIVCGSISIVLESYAFHSDVAWSRKVTEYSGKYHGEKNITLRTGFICEQFELEFDNDTSAKYRPSSRTGEKLYFPSDSKHQLKEKDLSIDQNIEKAYLIINVLITVGAFAHFVLCCVTRRIIYRTKYNAIYHGLAIGMLVLCAIMLTTSRYTIEKSYGRIAFADPKCIKVMACIGENREYPAYDLYAMAIVRGAKKRRFPHERYLYYMCQQSSIKTGAAIINLVYVGFCGAILCSSMRVVIQYGDEEFIPDDVVGDSDFNTNHRLSISYNKEREIHRHSLFSGQPSEIMSVTSLLDEYSTPPTPKRKTLTVPEVFV